MNDKAKIIKIYISNTDLYKDEPLYQFLARIAKELNMAGATIYKGIMGYGCSSSTTIHTRFEFTYKSPIMVEIVDNGEKIERFFEKIKPALQKDPKGCIITTQDVEVKLITLDTKTPI